MTFLASLLVACPKPSPELHAPMMPAEERSVDVDTVDLLAFSQRLEVAPEVLVLERPQDCMVLASRAHAQALSLEEKGPSERLEPQERRSLFLLHALAAELIEYATAWPPPAFYGEVDHGVVSLHDLRAAQLARLDPLLLDDSNPIVDLRRETIEFYLHQMEGRPAWADTERVMSMLRTQAR